MAGQPGFFDLDERYRVLADSGDLLIRLTELVDFEVFWGSTGPGPRSIEWIKGADHRMTRS